MKFRTPFSQVRLTLLCVAALLLVSCGNRFELKRANDDYQQALAANDVVGQRLALLALTRADDGVSEYWIALAQIELQLGLYGDAYAHFSRAHELDRTAIGPLSMMTELAVINGRVDMAEDHLKKLTVIAPNDRAVSVARGFTALRQGNFAKAQENVDVLLKNGPRDTVANILQARLFTAQRKFPEAIAFLNGKLGQGGDDGALLRSISAIQRYLGNWTEAAQADVKLWQASPASAPLATRTVGDALQANNIVLANEVTQRFLKEAKSLEEANSVLSAWVDLGPSSEEASLPGAASLPEHSKIALANYFNRIGRPDRALSLLGKAPRPVNDRANTNFNAVFAEALMMKGQMPAARQLLDRILASEPDHIVALSARARLLSKLGDHRAATADAQRLVTSYNTVADHRVLLAQIYRANRDGRWAERTLWDGYRDLPGNETLYRQLQQALAARGDRDGLARIKRSHDEERYSRLMKELA